MKIDLEFVALHGPVFISHDNGGTNFGEKLYIDPKRNKAPLDALYLDTIENTLMIVVKYKGKISYIQSWQNVVIKDDKYIAPVAAQVIVHNPHVRAQVSGPEKPFTAQVSTPLDKVQGKPGKKAKYQGEESQGE